MAALAVICLAQGFQDGKTEGGRGQQSEQDGHRRQRCKTREGRAAARWHTTAGAPPAGAAPYGLPLPLQSSSHHTLGARHQEWVRQMETLHSQAQNPKEKLVIKKSRMKSSLEPGTGCTAQEPHRPPHTSVCIMNAGGHSQSWQDLALWIKGKTPFLGFKSTSGKPC